jgi:hypothetical protein
MHMQMSAKHRETSVIRFLLGYSPARRYEVIHTYLPMKMKQTECSETLALTKLQTSGNNPGESIRYSENGKSLKSRTGKLH